MAARKRASATATTTAAVDMKPTETEHKSGESTSLDPPIAPSKLGVIAKLCLFFSIPYFYLLFFH
ncbi:hypothetical protein SLEP1_g42115 [Rubroshorea leprosula]|uniref:Uncharacterized protein n=1 Tax=Rubroshorea leprosula TaxID=152421 RepID=A0AAV5L8W2_9ROSI|nr:hypothetical protein SLEP1_g42115 [Rubroshorea leprosula]